VQLCYPRCTSRVAAQEVNFLASICLVTTVVWWIL